MDLFRFNSLRSKLLSAAMHCDTTGRDFHYIKSNLAASSYDKLATFAGFHLNPSQTMQALRKRFTPLNARNDMKRFC